MLMHAFLAKTPLPLAAHLPNPACFYPTELISKDEYNDGMSTPDHSSPALILASNTTTPVPRPPLWCWQVTHSKSRNLHGLSGVAAEGQSKPRAVLSNLSFFFFLTQQRKLCIQSDRKKLKGKLSIWQ